LIIGSSISTNDIVLSDDNFKAFMNYFSIVKIK
jgi:hypothetical protein